MSNSTPLPGTGQIGNPSNLIQAAKDGSETAQELLAKIQRESKEAIDRKQAEAFDRAEKEAAERLAKITFTNNEIKEALDAYEGFKELAQQALNKAFLASFTLPQNVNPTYPVEFLRKAHLPSAFPKPMDPLWPSFTTTECFIQEYLARGAKL